MEASYGVISNKPKGEQVEHAKQGLSLADEWAEILHSEEIIRKSEL